MKYKIISKENIYQEMAFILPTYFIFYATAGLRQVISLKNSDIEIAKENLISCLILQ